MPPETVSTISSQTPQLQTLDPEAVNLAKAIRQTESGGNFQAKGKSGEYGAYQFTPDTWVSASRKYLGTDVPLQQATPEQQNEVAYKQIKEWKDTGNNIGQIASMWNAGGRHANAYLENYRGTNSQGQKFDTPAYAKSVATAYQTIKNGGQVQVDPNNPSSVSNTKNMTSSPESNQPTDNLKSFGEGALNVAKGLTNFFLPIVGDVYHDVKGDSQKSVLQQAADLGLSGLMFVPGLGEATKVGEGAGLLGKVLGSQVVKGAALGYGAGTLSSISQGKGVRESLAPNLGNIAGAVTGGAAGAIIPKVSKALSGLFSQSGALRAIQDNLESEMGRTVPGRTLMSNLPNKGQKALKLIVQSGALPEVEGNNFAVDPAIQKLEGRISQLGQARAAALDKVTQPTSLDELAAAAKAKISEVPENATLPELHAAQQRKFSGEVSTMQSKIDSIVNDIKATAGQSHLSASELEAFKEAQMKNSGIFKRTGAIGDQNAASLLGTIAKDKIESLSNEAGFPGMKEYNQYMKDHYDAISLLQKLGRQTVKGGRLGKMLLGHVAGAALGAVNMSSGGLLGSIGGLITGEMGGNFLGKLMSDASVSNPFRDVILSKIQQEDPRIVQELMQFAGKSGKVAPLAVPKASSKIGILPPLLMKTAARGGGSIK